MSDRPDSRGREPGLVVRVVNTPDHVTDSIDLGIQPVEERSDALEALGEGNRGAHCALLPVMRSAVRNDVVGVVVPSNDPTLRISSCAE
jgi:hypothetical protein